MSEDTIHDALSALIGKGSETRRIAPDPVSRAQIRRWLEAMGDDDIVCLKEERAPRGMLPVFTNRGLSETIAGNDDISVLTSAMSGFELLPAGVGIAHDYFADIRVGDMIRETTLVESVSPRKVTRLGAGYFITVRTDFFNQADEKLGVQRITVLAYPRAEERAGTDGSSTPPPPSPLVHGPSSEALPLLAVTMDRLGIIAACAACGDFAAGHYDPDIARDRGFQDIFTDVYTGIGLVHRFVTGWAGPGSRLDGMELKLGASFYAGDTLQLSGDVRGSNDGRTMLGVRGLCRTGVHLDGTVTLTRC